MRDEETVNDNLCQAGAKPKGEQDCDDENCVHVPDFAWRTGDWSKCSSTCGYSLRSRNVECVKGGEVVVNDSICAPPMPTMIDQCFEGPCPPQWYAEDWSEVSCAINFQQAVF